MSCDGISVVTMGGSFDSLDVCFGTQLVDSRGDIGVIYAQGLLHVLVFCFSGRNLGALFDVVCVGLSIMNLNLLWCYFSTNSRIDRTERIALCYFSRTLEQIGRKKPWQKRGRGKFRGVPGYSGRSGAERCAFLSYTYARVCEALDLMMFLPLYSLVMD